jgi:hypothetical protein
MHRTMKHLCLATIGLLIGCAGAPYGKVRDSQKFDALSGDFTEGFAAVHAAVLPNESQGGNVRLLTQRKKKIDVSWHDALPAVSKLDATKSYDFDLIVQDWHQGNEKTATVFRIREGERVLADLSQCELHQQPMKREAEDWIDQVDPRKAKRYPNSGIFHAFCSSGMRHVVWVCPSCQDAERKEVLRAQR